MCNKLCVNGIVILYHTYSTIHTTYTKIVLCIIQLVCLCGVLHYRQAALQRSQDGGPSGDKDGENDNGDTIVDPFKPISVREQRVKVSLCVCMVPQECQKLPSLHTPAHHVVYLA